jgi:hypothetical protein
VSVLKQHGLLCKETGQQHVSAYNQVSVLKQHGLLCKETGQKELQIDKN